MLRTNYIEVAKITRADLVGKIATLHGALQTQRAVSFTYDGKQRVVDVHAVGTSTKDGGLVMRGVQTDGQASRPLPQWTLFRVEGMQNLSLTFIKSEAPREGYSEGDRQMSNIIMELDI